MGAASAPRDVPITRTIAWDTETCLIRPGCYAPALVCLTWQTCEHAPDSPTAGATLQSQIVSRDRAGDILGAWLRDRSVRLVGHNLAYDTAVVGEAFPELLPLVFAAYADDRFTCTQVRAQLLDIASGQYRRKHLGRGVYVKQEYTLEALAKRYAGIELQKDAWRVSYAEFLGLPLREWPDRARAVQEKARTKMDALTREVATARAAGARADDPGIKARESEIKSLASMVASDPARCTEYALEDARATLAVYLAQEKHAHYLADEYNQARAAFALHLSSAWGLRTDAAGVDVLETEVRRDLLEVEETLMQAGIVRPDGSRDTKVAKAYMFAACTRERVAVPRTDGHITGEGKCRDAEGNALPDGDERCAEHVALDSDSCAAFEDDEILSAYAELSTLKKVLGNDVEALRGGLEYPIHTRYGMAETGRTTSSKPNIQNWVRARTCGKCEGKGTIDGRACALCGGTGYRAGARECFVPRPGFVFIQADYPQLELYTLAQCCVAWFGRSALADMLNAGIDPHTAFAAELLGAPYDETKRRVKDKAHPEHKAANDARQIGKAFNFGKPGGLGDPKLVKLARKGYGVDISLGRAKELTALWYKLLPEMPEYFARVNAQCDNDSGRATDVHLWTNRYRGQASYCAACNSPFQGLGADCAKRALFLIARAQYDGAAKVASPLWNSRTVAFVHDEIIAETPESPALRAHLGAPGDVHDAAWALARLMVEGANRYLPDVPIKLEKMEPTAMRRWSKFASQVFDANGRLIPWG